METNGDRQKVRLLPRLSLRTLATGVLGAAAVGAALLFTAGQAQAAPVNIPGVGEFEIPNEIAAPFGLAAPAVDIPAPAVDIPAPAIGIPAPAVTIPTPAVGIPVPAVTIPAPAIGVPTPAVGIIAPAPESANGETDASRMVVAPGHIAIPPAYPPPDSASALSLAPQPLYPTAATPAPESRSVVVAGLGTFMVPASLPPLSGIPGVTDSAVAPFRTPVPAAMPKTAGQRAVDAARTKIGADYRAGGNGPDSFDCSGFVQWSYREAGVEVPRTSYSQLSAGTPVTLDELEPGDLVSYYGGGHSAMYLGDGKVIHASDYGSGVKVSPLSNMPVTGARRFQ
ncbi:NlpC/P60 family protein [Nocardia tengchongensis]|uniref:C40 family peptidase n=1 Tax=Nocardia tengchongensis TaxID=2055889 RepID=UPI003692754F